VCNQNLLWLMSIPAWQLVVAPCQHPEQLQQVCALSSNCFPRVLCAIKTCCGSCPALLGNWLPHHAGFLNSCSRFVLSQHLFSEGVVCDQNLLWLMSNPAWQLVVTPCQHPEQLQQVCALSSNCSPRVLSAIKTCCGSCPALLGNWCPHHASFEQLW